MHLPLMGIRNIYHWLNGNPREYNSRYKTRGL